MTNNLIRLLTKHLTEEIKLAQLLKSWSGTLFFFFLPGTGKFHVFDTFQYVNDAIVTVSRVKA